MQEITPHYPRLSQSSAAFQLLQLNNLPNAISTLCLEAWCAADKIQIPPEWVLGATVSAGMLDVGLQIAELQDTECMPAERRIACRGAGNVSVPKKVQAFVLEGFSTAGVVPLMEAAVETFMSAGQSLKVLLHRHHHSAKAHATAYCKSPVLNEHLYI